MPIAIDTETTLFGNSEPVPRLVSVAFAGPGGVSLHAGHEPAVARMIVDALAEGAIFANAPFDIYVILRRWPNLLGAVIDAYTHDRIHDVETREKLIDIAEGFHFQRGRYNLGAVAKRRAGIDLDKDDPWRLRYVELLGVDIAAWPEAARKYALHDAAATYGVFVAQEQHPYAAEIFHDAPRQARKHLALHAQTLRGMYTDQARVDEVDRRLLGELVHHTTVCLQHGLARAKGSKVTRVKKAAQELMSEHCASLGLRPRTTDKGAIQLSEDALTAARIPKGHPLDSYRKLGSLQSQRSKNIPVLRRPWIRTRYDECVGSGRTSSSAPNKKPVDEVGPDEFVGTNMQNQQTDGGFRECLVPPPGHAYAISDWSGAELVTLAQVEIDLFGRSTLGDMIREGRDVHSEVAANMTGKPVEAVTKPERNGAKAFNFGKAGAMGEKRFIDYALDVYGVTFTPAEHKEKNAAWLDTFPEHRLFFDHVRSLEGIDGSITVVQPRSNRIRGRLRYPEACNTHFQGLAADAAGETLWRLLLASLDPSSPLYAGPNLVDPDTGHVPLMGQCLFVHDENVTVVPLDRAEACLAEQDRIMIDTFAKWCPDVPIKVESSIQERYCK